MPKELILPLIIYIAIISVISIILTVYDKTAAKVAKKHRTRESVLLLFSALGGSVAMYLTMLGIRHKTKHKRFMIGIPLIFLLQVAFVYLLFYFEIITI